MQIVKVTGSEKSVGLRVKVTCSESDIGSKSDMQSMKVTENEKMLH